MTSHHRSHAIFNAHVGLFHPPLSLYRVHAAAIFFLCHPYIWSTTVLHDNPSGSAVSPYHYYQPPNESSSVPNNATHLPSDCQTTPVQAAGPDTCEERIVKFKASLKVLNPANKRLYHVYTEERHSRRYKHSCFCKETIFEQVGENIVSRKLEFLVGFYGSQQTSG